MELPIGGQGLLEGPLPGPISGIVGYDVFARTIVEIPAANAHSTPAPPSTAAALELARSARRQPGRKPGRKPGQATSAAGSNGAKRKAAYREGMEQMEQPGRAGRVRLLPPYRNMADMPAWMRALDWRPLRVVCDPYVCVS